MKNPIRASPLLFALLLICLHGGVAIPAQYVIGVKAGIIQYVQGHVWLDGDPVRFNRGGYLQMQPGQTLATELGFAEMMLGPDVYVRMGAFGRLRLENNKLEDTLLTLESGSALVEVLQGGKGRRSRVRLAQGEVEIVKKGLYRIDASSGDVRVYGGSAWVSNASGRALVKSGRTVRLSTGLSSRKFEEKEGDSLHRWSARRSFDLFQLVSNPRLQNHWQRLAMGWAVNSNYRMRFFSERLLREWRLNQHVPLEVRIAAELEEKRAREAREYLEQQAIRAKKELDAARSSNVVPLQ